MSPRILWSYTSLKKISVERNWNGDVQGHGRVDLHGGGGNTSDLDVAKVWLGCVNIWSRADMLQAHAHKASLKVARDRVPPINGKVAILFKKQCFLSWTTH